MTPRFAEHVHKLFAAGADVDSIARTLGTHRAAVAQQLLPLSNSELVEGLRANLTALIESRPAKGKGARLSSGG